MWSCGRKHPQYQNSAQTPNCNIHEMTYNHLPIFEGDTYFNWLWPRHPEILINIASIAVPKIKMLTFIGHKLNLSRRGSRRETTTPDFLPPATKLEQGYVFTRVCDSVQGGSRSLSGGCVGVSIWGVSIWGVSVWGVSVQGGLWLGGLCLGGSLAGGSLSRGVSGWGVSVQGGLCPEGGLCPGGSLPDGSLSRGGGQGDLCPGGSLSGRGLCHGDPPMVTSGRYASYWNAFLF